MEVKIDGGKLKKLIEQKGMSKVKFAKAVGVTESALYRWIRGERCPRVDLYLKMLKVLGIVDDVDVKRFEKGLTLEVKDG